MKRCEWSFMVRLALARKAQKVQATCFITEARKKASRFTDYIDSGVLGMSSPTRFAVALSRSSDV